jgi:hypothetical protein
MIKLKELAGPSCLTAAADDEPLFVLRANDELAPAILREWARRYYDSKMDAQGKLTAKQKEKKEDALKIAVAMENWRDEKEVKTKREAAQAKAAAKQNQTKK